MPRHLVLRSAERFGVLNILVQIRFCLILRVLRPELHLSPASRPLAEVLDNGFIGDEHYVLGRTGCRAGLSTLNKQP